MQNAIANGQHPALVSEIENSFYLPNKEADPRQTGAFFDIDQIPKGKSI
jgi:hypothetical protein